MPYATIPDLSGAFGEAELIRLTTPAGQDRVAVVADRATRALVEASDLMDSYLRRRYAVPIQSIDGEGLPALRACCCALARYDLSFSGDAQPTEQVRLARRERITWLEEIAAGRVQLPGVPETADPQSRARVSDRGGQLHGRDHLGW